MTDMMSPTSLQSHTETPRPGNILKQVSWNCEILPRYFVMPSAVEEPDKTLKEGFQMLKSNACLIIQVNSLF